MKAIAITATLVLACAAMPATAQNQKKSNSAQGQLNQANQSGRTFDGNRSGSGNSTLNQRDAVVAKPPPTTSQTREQREQQAIRDYRNSGRADPTPQSQRRTSAPPPSPTTSSSSSKKR